MVILSIQKNFQALLNNSNLYLKLYSNMIDSQEKYIHFGNMTEERISHSIKAMTRIRYSII